MTTPGALPIPVERLIDLEIKRRLSRRGENIASRVETLVKQVRDNVPLRNRLSENQVNGLLAVVNTTENVNEVRRFIQRQGDRREQWKQRNLAGQLISELRNLQHDAQEIGREVANSVQDLLSLEDREKSKPKIDDLTRGDGRWNEIYYLLVRDFIQSFAIAYRYNDERGQQEQQSAGGR